jgi:hypothetical protein
VHAPGRWCGSSQEVVSQSAGGSCTATHAHPTRTHGLRGIATSLSKATQPHITQSVINSG